MERETGMTSPVERTGVQLISRDDRIPGDIRIKSFTPRDGQKGLRFRDYYYNTQYQIQYANRLHYDVWKKHPWIRALVNKIANFATTVGFYIKYIGEGEADKETLQQITFFFQYPNYKESWSDILWKTIVQLKIFAESFWEMVKSSNGFAIDFYTLDGSVKALVDEHGNPLEPAYVQKVMNNTAEFNYDEVMHFRFPDPIGKLRPSSELEALELSVLIDVYAMQLNKQTFTQGIRKGKAFVFPADTGEEQMKRNRAQIDTLHSGIQGAFSAFISLEGECKIQDLELFETKMEAKDLREYVRDEIAAVIGTPLSKVGIKEVDVKEGEYIEKSFITEVISPILKLIEDTINRYLDLVGIYDYRFKFRKFPVRDLKEYARLIDVLKKHGIASINDLREMIGLDRYASKSCDIPFIMTRDGSIIFTTEIDSEKAKSEKVQETAAKSGAFSFDFGQGRRKVVRRGRSFPSIREEEEADEEEEEETSSDPFS